MYHLHVVNVEVRNIFNQSAKFQVHLSQEHGQVCSSPHSSCLLPMACALFFSFFFFCF